MKLGTNIYLLRTQKGLSQGDLADALDVSRQSVSKWETGGATPDLDKLLALCDLFGVTLDELVRGEMMDAPAANPAADPGMAQQTAAPKPTIEKHISSPLRTVLICTLLVLGLLFLPAIFFSPGAWPGILLLIVVGSLFYAVITRLREQEPQPQRSEQDRKRATRKRLVILILCLLALFAFVLGYIFTTREPVTYAQVMGTTTLVPRKDAPIEWVDFSGGKNAVSYTIKNTSSVALSFSKDQRRIEVKEDKKWHVLKQLTLPVYVENNFLLGAGESHQDHFYLQQVYGRLAPGQYRMMFLVGYTDGSPAYWIAKEFTIK